MRRKNASMPAREWMESLSNRSRGQLRAAAEIAENSIILGRASGGRIELVRISKHRLSELRVTPKGGKPPHLRLLFLRRGGVFWATHGFTKQSRKLDPKEIERGDRIAQEWIDSQGEQR